MYVLDYFQIDPNADYKTKHYQIIINSFVKAIQAIRTISKQNGVSYPIVLSGERIVYTA